MKPILTITLKINVSALGPVGHREIAKAIENLHEYLNLRETIIDELMSQDVNTDGIDVDEDYDLNDEQISLLKGVTKEERMVILQAKYEKLKAELEAADIDVTPFLKKE